jgi:hypothetical protein
LSIPLYVAPVAIGESDASPAAEMASLPTALAGWLESSAQVRAALGGLVQSGLTSRSDDTKSSIK